MAIKDKLLDELLKDYRNPEDLLGENGILKELTKRLLERAMQGEMTEHLGYEKNAIEGNNTGNSRNGFSKKTVKSKSGAIDLSVPRDRDARFNPKIIPKGRTRFDGFDDKIISLYARGMSTREIQGHLEEIYGVEVSPSLVSTVTDSVIDDVKAWQSRPLESVYPIVFLDAIMVKSREEGQIRNKSVYLALGVNMDGQKELLGLWIANSEGAKFWLNVLTELKNRGLKDIFIACVDGLKGFPDAIESVFSDTQIQLCIVHMVRNTLRYVSWKDKKKVAADIKKVYTANTVGEAELMLDEFCKKYNDTYPTIGNLWRNHWERVIPLFDYPKDIRKAMYTTNAIESINRSIRKIIKTKGAFPNDQSIYKIIYLALKNASKKWTMPIRDWAKAVNRFSIMFGDRMPLC